MVHNCCRDGVLAELAAQTGEASRERLLEIARAAYFRSASPTSTMFLLSTLQQHQCVPGGSGGHRGQAVTEDKQVVFRQVLQLEKTIMMAGDKPIVFRKVLQQEKTIIVAFAFPGSNKINFEGTTEGFRVL